MVQPELPRPAPTQATPPRRDRYEVRVLRDVPYVANAAPAQSLDLYVPRDKSGYPVVLSLHGGGLIEGDKAGDAGIALQLAEAGIGCAVANYRLSPGVSHPAHAEDAAAAFAWTRQHVVAHGGDPEQLFLVGHSAGGYLAALLATDPKYLQVHGLGPQHIRGLVPVSGFFWVDRVAPERPKHVWGELREQWLEASPARHLNGNLPPTLLVYADGDDPARQRQHTDIAELARVAGSSQLDLVQLPGRSHRSIWTRITEPGDELFQLLVSFVRASATSIAS